MAHDTAKKNCKRNQERIKTFWLITIVVNLLWIAMRYAGSPSYTDVFVLIFWMAQEVLCVTLLKAHGSPSLSGGEIIDCSDLSEPQQLGFFSYAQDCLWICWFVQGSTALISSWFWAIYLVVPIVAISKVFSLVISPLLSRATASQSAADPQQVPLEGDARSRLQQRRAQLRGGKR